VIAVEKLCEGIGVTVEAVLGTSATTKTNLVDYVQEVLITEVCN